MLIDMFFKFTPLLSIDYLLLCIYYFKTVAAKYRQLFLEMMEKHRDIMLDFKEVHDNFVKDEKLYKKEFNEKGAKVVEIIREYEMKLTSHQNSGQFSKYSSGLADKFWDQIRSFLPRIDFVGVK